MKTKLNFPKATTLLMLTFLLVAAIPNATKVFSQPILQSNATFEEPKIQGQVIDANEKAMAGISVIIKGSTTGTATDTNGFFALDLLRFSTEKVILVFSFPGYESKEVELDMKKLPEDLGQIKISKEKR
jgi:predicted TIM-barrel enzyme